MNEEQDPDALVTFDWTEFDSPSTSVITAVAGVAGIDPVAIDPLYETIDPDALDRIVAPRDRSNAPPHRSVEFAYRGYWVVVKANGRGYVYERDDHRLSAADSRPVGAPKQTD